MSVFGPDHAHEIIEDQFLSLLLFERQLVFLEKLLVEVCPVFGQLIFAVYPGLQEPFSEYLLLLLVLAHVEQKCLLSFPSVIDDCFNMIFI